MIRPTIPEPRTVIFFMATPSFRAVPEGQL